VIHSAIPKKKGGRKRGKGVNWRNKPVPFFNVVLLDPTENGGRDKKSSLKEGERPPEISRKQKGEKRDTVLETKHAKIKKTTNKYY